MKRTSTLVSLLILAFAAAPAAGDCTTFVLNSGECLIHARNMDYSYEHGLILVNKRDVRKTAFMPPELADAEPAQWTSKYGSVTLSCVGREFPCSGMNEVGLTVSEMTLQESRYPQPDKRDAVNVVQWIQYQLDNCATVEEVLATDESIRIFAPGKRGHHYLVCDATGACATVEYLNGRPVIHRRDALPSTVLTNDSYKASGAFLRKHIGFGGSIAVPQDHSSLARFVRAAELVRAYDQSMNPIAYSFQVLGAVAQGRSTVWSLAFDIEARRLHFRTLSHPAIKFIELRDLDFCCDTPMKMLDMRQFGEGDVTDKLEAYTAKAHGEFLRVVLNENEEIRQIAGDPEAFVADMNRYYATLKPARDTKRRAGERTKSDVPHVRMFQSQDVPIAYLDEGQGEPVVLLQGFGGRLRGWKPMRSALLRSKFRVIAMDSRGHGQSGKPHDEASYGAKMADDVVRLLDHLEIRRAHVVGYSMGGDIANKVRELYPSRVTTVTMGGVGMGVTRGWTSSDFDYRKVAESLKRGDGLKCLFAEPDGAGRQPLTAGEIETMNVDFMKGQDQLALAAVVQAYADLEVSEDSLKDNAVPTLSVVGEHDPERPTVEDLAKVMENLKVVVISDADHFSAGGKAELIQSVVRFLKTHPDT